MAKTPKHLQGLGKNYPRIGNMVHYHILKHKIKKADISRALDIDPTGLNDYFKRDSLQFAIIYKLSHAMQHNFMAQLSEFLPYHFETQREKELREKLAEKEAQIQKMEIQMEIYEKMLKR